MAEILPAILVRNADNIAEKLAAIPKEFKLIHFDVLEDDVWEPLDREFEAHLMVTRPQDLFERWVKRGAKRIIVHDPKFEPREGVEVGLGVEMQVNLDEVFKKLGNFKFVHLMSIVEIGEQGHPFDERVFDRIKKVQEHFPGMPITVDGGVNVHNYERLIAAGVQNLVVGSGFQELWQTLRTKK